MTSGPLVIQVYVTLKRVAITECKNELPHGKTNKLHRRKQRRRSASR